MLLYPTKYQKFSTCNWVQLWVQLLKFMLGKRHSTVIENQAIKPLKPLQNAVLQAFPRSFPKPRVASSNLVSRSIKYFAAELSSAAFLFTLTTICIVANEML